MKLCKIGDYIKFKSPTRDGCRTVVRKIKNIDSYGRPEVGYMGYTHFIVKQHEIIEVLGENKGGSK